MITEIPLQAVPNQSLSVSLGDQIYAIEIDTRRDCLYATVRVDGDVIVRNRRLVSFQRFEGDLVVVDSMGEDDPVWQELGARYQLLYWPDNA